MLKPATITPVVMSIMGPVNPSGPAFVAGVPYGYPVLARRVRCKVVAKVQLVSHRSEGVPVGVMRGKVKGGARRMYRETATFVHLWRYFVRKAGSKCVVKRDLYCHA